MTDSTNNNSGRTRPNGSSGRMLKGIVVSDKMTKTIVVSITRLHKHPKYKKYYKITSRYKVHDPEQRFHVGDHVWFQETRPISKDKRWIAVRKVT